MNWFGTCSAPFEAAILVQSIKISHKIDLMAILSSSTQIHSLEILSLLGPLKTLRSHTAIKNGHVFHDPSIWPLDGKCDFSTWVTRIKSWILDVIDGHMYHQIHMKKYNLTTSINPQTDRFQTQHKLFLKFIITNGLKNEPKWQTSPELTPMKWTNYKEHTMR